MFVQFARFTSYHDDSFVEMNKKKTKKDQKIILTYPGLHMQLGPHRPLSGSYKPHHIAEPLRCKPHSCIWDTWLGNHPMSLCKRGQNYIGTEYIHKHIERLKYWMLHLRNGFTFMKFVITTGMVPLLE